MSDLEVGDLIAYSPMTKFTSMKFGIVAKVNQSGPPTVWGEVRRYKSGEGWRTGIEKVAGSSNYIIIRKKDGSMDDRNLAAVDWHIHFDK